MRKRSVTELDWSAVLEIQKIGAVYIRDTCRDAVQYVIDVQSGQAIACLAGQVELQNFCLACRNTGEVEAQELVDEPLGVKSDNFQTQLIYRTSKSVGRNDREPATAVLCWLT